MALAALHKSAPSARLRTIENPLVTFPAHIILILSLIPAPIRILLTNVSPKIIIINFHIILK